MRSLGQCLLACGILLSTNALVRSAQSPKIIAEEGAIELMLLRQQSVHEELKLSKDQIQKIETFADANWKRAQEIHQLEADKSKAQFEELGKANEKFIAETLNPQQQKRLCQIGMQVAGLIWILDSRVSKEIKLTDEQKTKVKELHKAAHKEVESVLHSPDKTGRDAKLEELKKAHRKELLGVLTDEQKTTWKQLAGEPFKGKFHFAELDGKEK